MRVGRHVTRYAAIAAVVLGAWPSRVLAQDDHSHMMTAGTPGNAGAEAAGERPCQGCQARDQQFQNVENAGPDYVLQFGCVSGGDFGAMGMHFVNGALVGDGEVDVMSRDPALRAVAERAAAIDRRRLPGPRPPGRRTRSTRVRRSSWANSFISSTGPTALVFRLLHAPRLGVEGQSQRNVRELEPQRVVRRIQRAPPLSLTVAPIAHRRLLSREGGQAAVSLRTRLDGRELGLPGTVALAGS